MLVFAAVNSGQALPGTNLYRVRRASGADPGSNSVPRLPYWAWALDEARMPDRGERSHSMLLVVRRENGRLEVSGSSALKAFSTPELESRLLP